MTYPPPSTGQIQAGAWLIKTRLESFTTIPSLDAVFVHGVIALKTPDKTEGGTTLDQIREEMKPKEIKLEGFNCPDIIQKLFPSLCNQNPN